MVRMEGRKKEVREGRKNGWKKTGIGKARTEKREEGKKDRRGAEQTRRRDANMDEELRGEKGQRLLLTTGNQLMGWGGGGCEQRRGVKGEGREDIEN